MRQQITRVFLWAVLVGVSAERLSHSPTLTQAGFWFVTFWIGLAIPFSQIIGAAINVGAREPVVYREQHVATGQFKGSRGFQTRKDRAS